MGEHVVRTSERNEFVFSHCCPRPIREVPENLEGRMAVVRGVTLNDIKLIYILSFSFPTKLVPVTVP